MKSLSRVWLFATPWTVAYQAPQSIGFSRQESWRGLPFPSPRDLPNPGIEPGSPALWADALPSEPPVIKPAPPVLEGKILATGPPGKSLDYIWLLCKMLVTIREGTVLFLQLLRGKFVIISNNKCLTKKSTWLAERKQRFQLFNFYPHGLNLDGPSIIC